MGVSMRQATTVAAGCLLASAMTAAAQSQGPAPSGPTTGALCLVSIDELDEVTGLVMAQPILFFMTDPPDPGAFLAPLAGLLVARLPAEGS
ncbi:MAG: hypothetical protein R3C32_03315 [Chloroflexota bacterium]